MSLATKFIAGALVVLVLGLPVLETWKVLLLGISVLALVFGSSRHEWWRFAAAIGVVLAVVALKGVLPRADIAEAHNPFLVIHANEALERGLPPNVFANWKQQFDALYPPDREPYGSRSQWRSAGVPPQLYTRSSDAIWRKAKYTRQVDAIEFHSLGEFRGGFANELQYNFWSGELLREWMPFYVMYELTPASVGSRLEWKGQVFWENRDGHFDELNHSQVSARVIAPEDAGNRVYAVFFPKRDDPLYFKMVPSLKLRLSWWAEALLSAIGAIAVLILTVRQRWPAYLGALLISGVGYLLMSGFLLVSAGKYLGRTYPPQGGGDDGLSHDAMGRAMAMLARSGKLAEALKGGEAVYWNTPGTRYFRMVEKLVFGDTNHLYALVVVSLPVLVFHLVRRFAGAAWAWGTTVMFLALPVGNLSYLNYLANAKLGYGETLAGSLFLLGLILMLETQPQRGSAENLAMTWAAGATLAASMFVRPNFVFAVAWLGGMYALASWKHRDLGRVLAFGSGLALALWMALHNWLYGRQFYLLSASRGIAIPLGPGDYAAALADTIRGRFDTGEITIVLHQLRGWLWSPGLLVRPELAPLAWAFQPIKLVALAVTCWVVLRWAVSGFAIGTDLAIVAMAALLIHLPMLFVFATQYRYAMLGWDLCLIVLIVSIANRWGSVGMSSS